MTALFNVLLAGFGAANAVLGFRSPLYYIELAAAGFLFVAGMWQVLMIAVGSRGRKKAASVDPRVTQLAAEARTDNLTKLGNHRAFHHDLTETIAQRASTGMVLTLMAIDLDGLKQINDTKGHPAGDLHIQTVAECLESTVGDQGTVYRTGGDEFMVIMPGRRNWHGMTMAHKVQQATQAATGKRAVSIGVTESTANEGRQLLVHQADLALYEAKRTKLSAVAFHPGLSPAGTTARTADSPSHEQRTLAAALARAVDAKDSGTRSHSETVAHLCVAIGERLGVPSENLERLRIAGLLHDVGKLVLPLAFDPAALDAIAAAAPVGARRAALVRERLGVDHAYAGALPAGRSGASAEVVEAVADHHGGRSGQDAGSSAGPACSSPPHWPPCSAAHARTARSSTPRSSGSGCRTARSTSSPSAGCRRPPTARAIRWPRACKNSNASPASMT
jgi:diguanylate cyclase (GGDEF)-like protein/putative nucleotidyltransferase with HDIG domain